MREKSKKGWLEEGRKVGRKVQGKKEDKEIMIHPYFATLL